LLSHRTLLKLLCMAEARIRAAGKATDQVAGEELAIRFVNTLAWRKAEIPEERLPDPSALLDWLESAGLSKSEANARLRLRWRKLEGKAVYREAIELREALCRLFLARGLASPPSPRDLRSLNRMLAAGTPRVAAVETKPSADVTPSWRLAPRRATPTDMLAGIAWSAAELMTGPRAERVRQCADEQGCGWLFLDQSRLNNRRWCSMGDCGNRAKARRHYRRKNEVSGGAGPRRPIPSRDEKVRSDKKA
jgi:predicted RNA-binding Zn ribbon-like protein